MSVQVHGQKMMWVRNNLAPLQQLNATVFMDDEMENYPWVHIKEIKDGGWMRNGVSTNVKFVAEYKAVWIEWYVDLEKKEANGKNEFDLDFESIAMVCGFLPKMWKQQFIYRLQDFKVKTQERAEEYISAAGRLQEAVDKMNGFLIEGDIKEEYING